MISNILAEAILTTTKALTESASIKLEDNTIIASSSINKSNILDNEDDNYKYFAVSTNFNTEEHIGKKITTWRIHDAQNNIIIWENANFTILTPITPAVFIIKSGYNE